MVVSFVGKLSGMQKVLPVSLMVPNKILHVFLKSPVRKFGSEFEKEIRTVGFEANFQSSQLLHD